MALDIESLKIVGIIGVCYFIVRIIGKYLGALFGSLVTRRPSKTTKYLGLAFNSSGWCINWSCLYGTKNFKSRNGEYAFNNYFSFINFYMSLLVRLFAKLSLFLSGSIKKYKNEEKLLW
ncbi:MAG: hypothetical protein L6U99_08405 [Clostridium sp.]|nr:MAG: hypothetical protein L6U99_08405 [Clostridium sp.]